MAKSFVKAIAATQVNSNLFGAGLVPINVNGLDQACFLLRIINKSNMTVFISYDHVNAADIIPPNNTLQLDFQTNSAPNGYIANLRKGTIVYADAAAAGVGIVYLVGYYQEI